MTDLSLVELSSRLDQAATTRITIPPLTEQTELTENAAYQIQRGVVDARIGRGARLLGGKLGLTSRAKQIAMGVDEPLYGFVTSDMLADGSELDLDALIHPRVEPEIAFVLAEPVQGPDATAADVLGAT